MNQSRKRTIALAIAVGCVATAAFAPQAMASTAGVSGGRLTVNGDSGGDNFRSIYATNNTFVIQDAAGGSLTPSAGCAAWASSIVVCTNVTTSITVNAAGGEDYVGSASSPLQGNNLPVKIDGGPAVDHLWGSTGPDTIVGGGGNDFVNGIAGVGTDTLKGGAGADVMAGSAGTDVIVDTSTGIDSLISGGGPDTLWSYTKGDKTVDQVACGTPNAGSYAFVNASDYGFGSCARFDIGS